MIIFVFSFPAFRVHLPLYSVNAYLGVGSDHLGTLCILINNDDNIT